MVNVKNRKNISKEVKYYVNLAEFDFPYMTNGRFDARVEKFNFLVSIIVCEDLVYCLL